MVVVEIDRRLVVVTVAAMDMVGRREMLDCFCVSQSLVCFGCLD